MKPDEATKNERHGVAAPEFAIAKQRQLFYEILESIPAYVVLLTEDYHAAFANRVFRELFGVSDKKCYEFLFDRTEPCEVCETYKVLTDNTPRRWEWIGPNGNVYNVYDYPFIDTDGRRLILEMGVDITKQKLAEHNLKQLNAELEERIIERSAALTAQQKLLNDVMQEAEDVIYVKDLESRLVMANPALSKILAKPLEELIGKNDIELYDDAEIGRKIRQVDLKVINSGKAITIEEIAPTVKGMRTFFSNKVPYRTADGRIIGVIGISRDVTDRKHAEQELARIGAELSQKNEELESIIATASHDLRSPLMNIKGFSGELARDIKKIEKLLDTISMPEKVRENVDKVFGRYVPEAVKFIQTSADTISKMLSSLMQVAKSGTAAIHIVYCDVNKIFDHLIADMTYQLKDCNVEVSVEPLPQCRGDCQQLSQVFANLLDNAIKYRDPSRPCKIKVYAASDERMVTYCVEDNGKGIDESHTEKIFQLFTRLDPQAAQGDGVGLTIVKRIVERHGGKISAKSKLNSGTTFCISLPKQ